MFLSLSISAQTFTNLDYFNSFVDSSINVLSPHINKGDSLFLSYYDKNDEAYFLNRIQTVLNGMGATIVFEPQKAQQFLNYKIDNAGVQYNKVVKEGFMGEFSIERELNYSGEFSLRDKQKYIDQKGFEFSVIDTVDYKTLPRIENTGLEFTRSAVPDESFWDVFLEPVIAAGAIIITIFLLFSVRSN